ncbi:MAG: hypothetical protein U0Q12_02360 [Vicinamibacterales bacterium]
MLNSINVLLVGLAAIILVFVATGGRRRKPVDQCTAGPASCPRSSGTATSAARHGNYAPTTAIFKLDEDGARRAAIPGTLNVGSSVLRLEAFAFMAAIAADPFTIALLVLGIGTLGGWSGGHVVSCAAATADSDRDGDCPSHRGRLLLLTNLKLDSRRWRRRLQRRDTGRRSGRELPRGCNALGVGSQRAKPVGLQLARHEPAFGVPHHDGPSWPACCRPRASDSPVPDLFDGSGPRADSRRHPRRADRRGRQVAARRDHPLARGLRGARRCRCSPHHVRVGATVADEPAAAN